MTLETALQECVFKSIQKRFSRHCGVIFIPAWSILGKTLEDHGLLSDQKYSSNELYFDLEQLTEHVYSHILEDISVSFRQIPATCFLIIIYDFYMITAKENQRVIKCHTLFYRISTKAIHVNDIEEMNKIVSQQMYGSL